MVVGLFTGRWQFPDWYDLAQCRDMEWAVFFGEQNEDDTQLIGPGALRKAQSVCAQCPVAAQCLAHALDKRILHGVWSGTSGRTRARIWAMERRGEVTRNEVLADFANGETDRYERLPRRVGVGVDVGLDEPVDAASGHFGERFRGDLVASEW